MHQQSELNWRSIRERAELFPEEAFDFVRAGLSHTVERLNKTARPGERDSGVKARHVSGRQLCEGLRDLAVTRYGLLARTVLRRWGIVKTDDFGTIVYALIDRGELRSSEDDSLEHFRNVYAFDDVFPEPALN